jgi:hypothetical protein
MGVRRREAAEIEDDDVWVIFPEAGELAIRWQFEYRCFSKEIVYKQNLPGTGVDSPMQTIKSRHLIRKILMSTVTKRYTQRRTYMAWR